MQKCAGWLDIPFSHDVNNINGNSLTTGDSLATGFGDVDSSSSGGFSDILAGGDQSFKTAPSVLSAPSRKCVSETSGNALSQHIRSLLFFPTHAYCLTSLPYDLADLGHVEGQRSRMEGDLFLAEILVENLKRKKLLKSPRNKRQTAKRSKRRSALSEPGSREFVGFVRKCLNIETEEQRKCPKRVLTPRCRMQPVPCPSLDKLALRKASFDATSTRSCTSTPRRTVSSMVESYEAHSRRNNIDPQLTPRRICNHVIQDGVNGVSTNQKEVYNHVPGMEGVMLLESGDIVKPKRKRSDDSKLHKKLVLFIFIS